MHRRLPPCLVLAVLLAGCGGGPTAPVDRETFVRAVVALREAATDAGSPEAFQARRADVLAEAGVSEEELRGYVEAWGNEPGHMAAVWAEVRDRLQGSVDPEMPLEEEGGPFGDDAMPLEEEGGPPGDAALPLEDAGPGAPAPDALTPEGQRGGRLPRALPRALQPPPDTAAAPYSHSMVAGGFELTS